MSRALNLRPESADHRPASSGNLASHFLFVLTFKVTCVSMKQYTEQPVCNCFQTLQGVRSVPSPPTLKWLLEETVLCHSYVTELSGWLGTNQQRHSKFLGLRCNRKVGICIFSHVVIGLQRVSAWIEAGRLWTRLNISGWALPSSLSCTCSVFCQVKGLVVLRNNFRIKCIQKERLSQDNKWPSGGRWYTPKCVTAGVTFNSHSISISHISVTSTFIHFHLSLFHWVG